MNLNFTEDQLKFQEEIREFVLKEISPGAVQRDQAEDYNAIVDILKNKMGPKGLLGLTFPKEYGGLGKSNIYYFIAMMEICKVDASIAASLSVCLSLGSIPIADFGTDAQKKKFLAPLCKGEKLCAFGLTEENAGSDSAMQETIAVLDGNEYVLNGKKIYITNAGVADIYIVIAMTDKSKGTKGISAFVVEKDTPGFTFGVEYKKMGIKSSIQRELIFENCRIPKDNLLGEEGQGFKIAMHTLDIGRIGVAGQGIGCAMGAYEIALKAAKERVQFGKPIIKNQGVSFMLADMAIQIEQAYLLACKVAWLQSEGLPFGKYASMAKVACTDAAMKVATDAVQICGGKGYLVENEVERLMRDAKILQIYEGTNQIQRLIISGHL